MLGGMRIGRSKRVYGTTDIEDGGGIPESNCPEVAVTPRRPELVRRLQIRQRRVLLLDGPRLRPRGCRQHHQ